MWWSSCSDVVDELSPAACPAGRDPSTRAPLIALAPDSDLAARLAEAGSSGASLLVDAGGVLYRLEGHPAGVAAPTSGQAIAEVAATSPGGSVVRVLDGRVRPAERAALLEGEEEHPVVEVVGGGGLRD